MSIQINKLKCVGCGKCVEACPGNLIKKDTDVIIEKENNNYFYNVIHFKWLFIIYIK